MHVLCLYFLFLRKGTQNTYCLEVFVKTFMIRIVDMNEDTRRGPRIVGNDMDEYKACVRFDLHFKFFL